MTESKFITCSHCMAKNRVPTARLNANPSCGKCKQPLFDDAPAELTDSDFQRYVQNNDLPIVVDFWASWCGPCQMMAPVFSELASQMKTQMRFAKVNTEIAQQVAGMYAIRSIPTLMIFQNGKEITRQAGAMDKTNLSRWLNQFK